jgi:hypothetical protein
VPDLARDGYLPDSGQIRLLLDLTRGALDWLRPTRTTGNQVYANLSTLTGLMVVWRFRATGTSSPSTARAAPSWWRRHRSQRLQEISGQVAYRSAAAAALSLAIRPRSSMAAVRLRNRSGLITSVGGSSIVTWTYLSLSWTG